MTITELIQGIINARNKIRNKMISAGQASSNDNLSTLAENLTISNGSETDTSDATAGIGDILSTKTAYISTGKVTGSMPNNGAVSPSFLNAGESYIIPKGYHNGSGKVTVNSLSSQTSGTAAAADILSGKTAYVNGTKVTGSMTNNGAVSPSALNAGGSYTIPKGYHNGSGKVTVNSLSSLTSGTATAADILNGKTAYVNGNKVTGTISSKSAQTYTPGTSNQTISSGQYLSGAQTIKGDTNLKAANIKSGVSIFGISGSYSGTNTTDATATAADLLSGKTAYVNGSKISGSMTNNGSVSPTALNAGGSYTIPKGYHSGSGKVTAATLASQTSGTATANTILSGKTAYVNGNKVTGTIATKSQSSTTITSATTFSAGYYPNSFTITPKAALTKTLVWTNPSPNSSFTSQTIRLSKSISTGGEYLLIYYKDSISTTNATRHSIVWAPVTYSSAIDVKGSLNPNATGGNLKYSLRVRNFWVESATTIFFNHAFIIQIWGNGQSEVQYSATLNQWVIPTQIYALGTNILS